MQIPASDPLPAIPSPADPLAALNDDQRAAVLHGGGEVAGPLLVIAGAGSGKTSTIAHRVAHLLSQGADPRRMLLMTFSRRAAAELKSRIAKIAAATLGDRAETLVAGLTWSGTFHAVGARLLREHAPAIGLAPDFTLHDREDSADLMNLARHELGLTRTESRFPAKHACLAIYSRVVNARTGLKPALEAFWPWCLPWEAEMKRLFAAYVASKQAAQTLDYDDLLLYWAEMLADADLAAATAARFDHVFVDEYQDTNRLQAEILLALKPDGRGLTVVGDDAQSIYGFRAAEVRNILDFPGQFSPRARIVTLERNYRSTAPILAAANAVIAEARERFAKTLWTDRAGAERPALVTVADEAAQAECVCRDVLAARERGIALKDQAVLFRTAHHSGPLEIELTRRNIPFVKFGGLKFLEAAHVKDLLGLLRFAENPRDRMAGFRILQLLPGIGPAAAATALDALAAAPRPSLAAIPAPRRAAPADWTALVEAFDGLREGRAGWPAEVALARAWYEPHLARLHPEDAGPRRSDLTQLGAIAAGFPDRSRFLTELTLDPPQASSDFSGPPLRDEDYLILSTIHSAKGQEWKRVTMLNCVDGCIPSDLATGTPAEIDEERRLFYVGMTRAKDTLRLMLPLRFFVHGQAARGDRHVYAARTRFLPEPVLALLDAQHWSRATADGGVAPAPITPRDLKVRMRDMWA